MAEPTRILILGGGFGGTAAALRLERIFSRDAAVEISLVDRENFSLFTPLLPEVPSGAIEPRHIVSPLRARLRRTIVRQAEVRSIDLLRRIAVVAHCPGCRIHVLPYDHLVLAIGSVANFFGLPGVETQALTMKSLADASALHAHVVDRFEHADMEPDRAARRELLTFVVVWAVGDCAFVLDPVTGRPYPPTAQHAVRQGRQVAENIAAVIRGRAPRPFHHTPLGTLAGLGRRSAVAEILGFRFSGFFAWWLWRTLYLLKLPGIERKVRVALDWTLDLFFPRDIVYLRPLHLSREVEADVATDRLDRP